MAIEDVSKQVEMYRHQTEADISSIKAMLDFQLSQLSLVSEEKLRLIGGRVSAARLELAKLDDQEF